MRTLALAACLALGCAGSTSIADGTDEASLTTASAISHLIVIVQENHSFDNYFGTWCTAPPGSSPTCTSGPGCCEAAPKSDPGSGTPQIPLTDLENATFDPNESQSCQLTEMDGGKMDDYVNASCGHYLNFSFAPGSLVAQYRAWAQQYALADRYFQPVAGASSANDMYFATARFMFADDALEPDAIGHRCSTNSNLVSYTSTSLGDLLNARGVTWSWYAEGYTAMAKALFCPLPPLDCPAHIPAYPCIYDPSDIPSNYFSSTVDQPANMRDLGRLATDLKQGTLPSVVFVKPLGYHTEHPFGGTTVSTGQSFVANLVAQIEKSRYASSTLVLVTYDEAGGWYDHVAPPPTSAVDNQPYGARVPLLALGPFARRNFISHETMEHSSVVRFIEWNWLGATGQLGARDAEVHNLGSLLDPAATAVPVPN